MVSFYRKFNELDNKVLLSDDKLRFVCKNMVLGDLCLQDTSDQKMHSYKIVIELRFLQESAIK